MPDPLIDSTPAVDTTVQDGTLSFEQWLLSMGFKETTEDAFTPTQWINLQMLYREHGQAAPGSGPPVAASHQGRRVIRGAVDPEAAFAEWAAGIGFEDVDALTDDQQAGLRETFDVLLDAGLLVDDDADPAADPAGDLSASALVRDMRRIEGIRDLCSGEEVPFILVDRGGRQERRSLQAHAIEAGWSRDELAWFWDRHDERTGLGPAVIEASYRPAREWRR